MVENLNNYDFNEFQSYLISGDYEKCSEFINTLLNEDVDIKQIYDGLLKKSLYNIGELWENGKITVATEHLASAIVETIMNDIYLKIIRQNKINKIAVLACTENEFHQIGIKMVNDIFEKNGWHVHFLGASTTTEELISSIGFIHPNIVAISLSIPFNLPLLEKMLTKIRAQYPDLYIFVGGQAFLHGGFEILKKFQNIIYIANLNELDEFLQMEMKDKN